MIQILPEKSIVLSLACNIFRKNLEFTRFELLDLAYPDLNGTAIIVNWIIMVAAHVRFLALSLWEAGSDFADVQLNCKDGVLDLNRFCWLLATVVNVMLWLSGCWWGWFCPVWAPWRNSTAVWQRCGPWESLVFWEIRVLFRW